MRRTASPHLLPTSAAHDRCRASRTWPRCGAVLVEDVVKGRGRRRHQVKAPSLQPVGSCRSVTPLDRTPTEAEDCLRNKEMRDGTSGNHVALVLLGASSRLGRSCGLVLATALERILQKGPRATGPCSGTSGTSRSACWQARPYSSTSGRAFRHPICAREPRVWHCGKRNSFC